MGREARAIAEPLSSARCSQVLNPNAHNCAPKWEVLIGPRSKASASQANGVMHHTESGVVQGEADLPHHNAVPKLVLPGRTMRVLPLFVSPGTSQGLLDGNSQSLAVLP